ncbi:MAG: OadG family transporter subunit [Candidatus Methanosuratincola sp.]|uniref:Oxaloacetate decarboxylase, gamma chain n=1 Tax=Methanosuratincola subterraneus TaxID=2593994 RepID=A0A3S4UH31_METS7|nr:OadG family transporter subunit [Candidatus Methanosuratincola sp.]RWX73713.1 MAG: hypothetical protein Metus_0492 [Candidatus Methanosuratincola subterraneus]
MDPIVFAATEALVGMGVTILLLGLLGAIFYAIGKVDRWITASKSPPAEEVAPAPASAATPAGAATQNAGLGTAAAGEVPAQEEDLPFIAAGVYLYLSGNSQRGSGSMKSADEECRKEWKRSARLCSVGLR